MNDQSLVDTVMADTEAPPMMATQGQSSGYKGPGLKLQDVVDNENSAFVIHV